MKPIELVRFPLVKNLVLFRPTYSDNCIQNIIIIHIYSWRNFLIRPIACADHAKCKAKLGYVRVSEGHQTTSCRRGRQGRCTFSLCLGRSNWISIHLSNMVADFRHLGRCTGFLGG